MKITFYWKPLIRNFILTKEETMDISAPIALFREIDGWYEVKQCGSHKQFKHPVKHGKVTVSVGGALNQDLDIKTEKSILKQAGLA